MDEILVVPSSAKKNFGMDQMLSWCTNKFKKSKGQLIGFSLESVTTPPFLEPEYKKDAFLFLARMPYREKKCRPRYNCGKYHHGKRKYILRTSQDTDPLYVSIWHHAISRDYTFSRKRMTDVDQEIAYIRHYNFQSKNINRFLGKVKDKENELFEPLNSKLLEHIETQITDNPLLSRSKTIAQRDSLLFSLRKK